MRRNIRAPSRSGGSLLTTFSTGTHCVETIGKVRQDHFVLGKSIKEICRTRGLSRGTVRKILRSETTAFHCDRQKQPYPRLGPWIDRLEEVLRENEKRPKKERFRGTRIWDDLRREGYEGSYDSVRPQPDRRMKHSLRRATSVFGEIVITVRPVLLVR